ncbi:MAG: nuclear transport factor 2 family protein [Verrucomicrobiota bacterium]
MASSPQEQNKKLVRKAFRPWEDGNSAPFFDLIADDVVWNVIGKSPVSGLYHSKREIIDKAFGPLLDRLDGPLKTTFIDLAAEGERVFLRFESKGITKNGIHYDQAYCFAMLMRDDRIVEIVAYLDTDLLTRVFA